MGTYSQKRPLLTTLTILGFSFVALPLAVSARGEEVAMPDYKGEYFSGSGVCTTCHTTLKDEAGNDVSIDTAWRATMMGNAARDPFWRMVLRGELIANPELREVIEGKCSTCHMPMARTTAAADGKPISILDEGFVNPKHELNQLALDSVSCTLCHQITPDKLGEKESYTGHYTVGSVKNKTAGGAAGEAVIYGQYVISPQRSEEMKSGSGYHPQTSLHIQDSALCGTCHNLYTPFVKTNGELGDYEVPEQVPYTEWENSAFNGKQSCQSCHMPLAQGKVQLSVTGGDPHHGFNQHSFIGANYYMLNILGKYGEDSQTPGKPEEFARNVNATLDLLSNATARVQLADVTEKDGKLSFKTLVKSETGHKFPSAYPARRAWLHTTVLDSEGKVIFESGASRPDGLIIGNDEDELPAAFEPHYDVITMPSQVQIYQSGLVNSDGVPTTTLLLSARYAKDNRILPQGFDKATAPADIQVYGEAKNDANFVAGEDVLTYEVDLKDAKGPFTVESELLYQSINYRWVQNLVNVHKKSPNAEADKFLGYYRDTPNLPALVSRATTAESGEFKNPGNIFKAIEVTATP